MSQVLHTYETSQCRFGTVRRAPVYCTVTGCGTPTKHGKPWCSGHVVTHSPAAAAVKASMDDYEEATYWANRGVAKRVDAQGELANDMMVGLVYDETGRATVHKLAHRVGLSHRGGEVVARKLRRAGLLRFCGTNSRGLKVVEAVV